MSTDVAEHDTTALLERVANGDLGALHALFDRYGPHLYAVALRITRHPNLAADTVQEAFIQVWQHAGTPEPDAGDAEAWTISLTRYRALDLVRRAGPALIPMDDDADLTAFDRLEPLDADAAGRALRTQLEAMEPARRRLLLMAYIEGFSQSELATQFVIPLGTIKAAIRKALATLKAEAATGDTRIADRAGLYVLGALNAEEMRATRVAAGREPELAAEIAAWERRLALLARLVPPAMPPATLWPQLEARLARLATAGAVPAEAYQAPVARRRSQSRRSAREVANWRAATVAALVLAAGLGAVLATRRPSPAPHLAMIIPNQPGQGGWLMQITTAGEVRATATGALSRALDQDFQLWAVAEGTERALPLGLLPVNGAAFIKGAKVPHAKYRLKVSLEAKGGSPSGAPTGPFLYISEAISP